MANWKKLTVIIASSVVGLAAVGAGVFFLLRFLDEKRSESEMTSSSPVVKTEESDKSKEQSAEQDKKVKIDSVSTAGRLLAMSFGRRAEETDMEEGYEAEDDIYAEYSRRESLGSDMVPDAEYPADVYDRQVPPFGMTDEEMELNGFKPGPDDKLYGSKALKKTANTPVLDTDGIDGIVSIDEDSPYYYKYEGTWTSVGVYYTDFRRVEKLTNGEVASLIDRNMKLNDTFNLALYKDCIEMWMKGEKMFTGVPSIEECGNVSVSGAAWMWMYSPIDGVLFSYLYGVEDDGTEYAACIKFNRGQF